MPFESYIKRGLLKAQRANFKQIERQIMRAKKDIRTAQAVIDQDADWAGTIAYHAILRAGRALIFSKGHLPTDGAQHRTVVELTGKLLGSDYALRAEKFERMRRRRNTFFYEPEPLESKTDTENSLKTAVQLVAAIEKYIHRENPQLRLTFGKKSD